LGWGSVELSTLSANRVISPDQVEADMLVRASAALMSQNAIPIISGIRILLRIEVLNARSPTCSILWRKQNHWVGLGQRILQSTNIISEKAVNSSSLPGMRRMGILNIKPS